MGLLHYGAQWKHHIAQHQDAALASLQLQGRTKKQNKPRRIQDRATTELQCRRLPKFRHMHSNQEVYSFAHLPPIHREKGLTLQKALHRIASIIVKICVAPSLEPTFVPTYFVVPRHWSSWARICDSTVMVYYQVWLDTRIA